MKKRPLKRRLDRKTVQDRIRRNVIIDPDTGCWLWIRRINNQGYPVMSMRLEGYEHPRPMFAHRVSLEVFVRPPESGEQAAHCPLLCPDNRHCVCPKHLRWASASENQLDNTRKRRLRLREVYPPLHGLFLD